MVFHITNECHHSVVCNLLFCVSARVDTVFVKGEGRAILLTAGKLLFFILFHISEVASLSSKREFPVANFEGISSFVVADLFFSS